MKFCTQWWLWEICHLIASTLGLSSPAQLWCLPETVKELNVSLCWQTFGTDRFFFFFSSRNAFLAAKHIRSYWDDQGAIQVINKWWCTGQGCQLSLEKRKGPIFTYVSNPSWFMSNVCEIISHFTSCWQPPYRSE